jgi:hypothetical protein
MSSLQIHLVQYWHDKWMKPMSAPNTPPAAGLIPRQRRIANPLANQTRPRRQHSLIDPSNALAVMLQLPQEMLPQEIKASVAKDAANSTTAPALEPSLGKAEANQLVNNIGAFPVNANLDLAAIASGQADAAARATQPANNIGAYPVNAKLDLAAIASGKADAAAKATQLAHNIDASLVNAKLDLAAIASGKADAAIMAADRLALHSGPSLEITKSAELSHSILSAGQSAQGIAQSAASMAASGIVFGMPTYNRASDSMQTISSPLGSSAWPEEFSQKISWNEHAAKSGCRTALESTEFGAAGCGAENLRQSGYRPVHLATWRST